MPRQLYFVGPSGKSLVVDVEQEDTHETLTAKIQAKNGGVIPEELRCDWDSPQMGKEHPDGFMMTTSEAVEKVLFWTRGRTTAGLQGVTTFMDILEPNVEVRMTVPITVFHMRVFGVNPLAYPPSTPAQYTTRRS